MPAAMGREQSVILPASDMIGRSMASGAVFAISGIVIHPQLMQQQRQHHNCTLSSVIRHQMLSGNSCFVVSLKVN